jgi:hypothetical protein
MPETPTLPDLFKDPNFDEMKSLYEIYRSYMTHEDDLINHRSTWHLLIQGFLFATFGVLGEWQSEGKRWLFHSHKNQLVFILAICGFLIAIAALCSIIAANIALTSIRKKWRWIICGNAQVSLFFPDIAGGGSFWARGLGMTPAVCIPCIVAGAWGFILYFSYQHGSLPSSPPPGARLQLTQAYADEVPVLPLMLFRIKDRSIDSVP